MSSSKVRVKRFTRDVAKKEKRFQERKRKRTPVVKFVELKATNDEEDDVQLADVMSDLEEDDVDNDVSHSKLISKISELNGDKKRRNIETRVEASNVVSDIHFSAAKDKIKLEDLLNSVNDPHGDLKKLVKLREQSKVLEAPLNKPERELVQRRAFYQDVSKEVSKWDSVVDAHRNANQVQFPLDETVIQLESTQEVVKTRFAKNNEFEQEIDNLLKSSQNHLTDDKPLTEAEEKFLKSVSLEEAKERHRELQRMRALLSYQETKMKRQKKIKSKRYRKILRKEKLTQQMKDF
ncbi:U3 small nucleolar RNA-associated protein 14 -like protein A [Halotydeus destructor]|nr:U3 small nucleolar RNA-associated protein 14 -like protein A [Halotydeus destructor]